MNTNENIILGEFPKAVLDQATAAARIRPASFLANRLDLRGKTIFAFAETVNSPAECAYSLYRKDLGWQLGIHVADVCEYVCEGSPLDTEARKRRATVRSGFSLSNMLPERIVDDVCNLAKNGDKLAISVILNLDENGCLLDVQFDESVIRISDVCIYSEIDQLQVSGDASAVALLREKYAPYRNILGDMYELAARFCVERRNRGGLDCTYFRKVYERNEEGKITSFRRVEEPDSRAMLREIGYFAAQAVGEYMWANKLPCVFNGRGAVDLNTLDYLSRLIDAGREDEPPAVRTARIADKAKGTPYYGFVCDALAMNVPPATYSTSPMNNSFCGCDTIISFFNPVSHYTDLLIQRVMKTAIKAKDPKNLNLNRQRKIVDAVANEANVAEQFIYNMRSAFLRESALEYLANSPLKNFAGFPVHTDTDGSVLVLLGCGLKAIIPVNHTENFKYFPAQPRLFNIIELGDDSKLTALQPID